MLLGDKIDEAEEACKLVMPEYNWHVVNAEKGRVLDVYFGKTKEDFLAISPYMGIRTKENGNAWLFIDEEYSEFVSKREDNFRHMGMKLMAPLIYYNLDKDIITPAQKKARINQHVYIAALVTGLGMFAVGLLLSSKPSAATFSMQLAGADMLFGLIVLMASKTPTEALIEKDKALTKKFDYLDVAEAFKIENHMLKKHGQVIKDFHQRMRAMERECSLAGQLLVI